MFGILVVPESQHNMNTHLYFTREEPGTKINMNAQHRHNTLPNYSLHGFPPFCHMAVCFGIRTKCIIRSILYIPKCRQLCLLYAQILILKLHSYRLRYNKISRNKNTNTKISFHKKKLKREGKFDFRHAK